MEIKLDEWQEKVLSLKGNMCICAGRQVGKSTIISEKAGKSALESKKSIMIIASTDRQSLLLFEKVLSWIHLNHRGEIRTGKDKPLKHELKLKNGSIIRSLPTGDSGYGIRGYTIDELYADEAAFIPEEVWAAVTPMLATTGGTINLLSTPFGINNYFHRCFEDKKFQSFHISTKEVAEKRAEPQKTNMLLFLKDEEERMTKLQFQQEYLGLFVGGIRRFIEDDLIDEILTIPYPEKKTYQPVGDKFQGSDLARMGGDEIILISGDRINRKRIRQFDLTIPQPQRITDTARLMIDKDKIINHQKMYTDDGGLGVGIYDILFEDQQTKNKIVGLNNARREIDKEGSKDNNRKVPLLGVEMSIFLKVLMEQGKIQLFDDPRIRQSLRSMQCDESDGVLKVYGNYNHIWEALKRLAHCMKDKSLNIYIY